MKNELVEIEPEQFALVEANELKFKYEQIEQDYEDIKDKLIDTSEKVSEHLSTIIDYTTAVPSAKSYEALAKVIIAISTLNRDTAAVIAQKKLLLDSMARGSKLTEEKGNVYNDNRSVVFNGSTNDLLDEARKRKIINDQI